MNKILIITGIYLIAALSAIAPGMRGRGRIGVASGVSCLHLEGMGTIGQVCVGHRVAAGGEGSTIHSALKGGAHLAGSQGEGGRGGSRWITGSRGDGGLWRCGIR